MRAPREHAADTTFHVTTHGVDDRPIFLDDIDRQTFVNRVGHIKRRLGWTVYALCLMTTHYHVVIQLSERNLSQGMTIVNGAHARLFNQRHERRGPVFEQRYDDTLIEDDGHLAAAIQYVHMNPVCAGMVTRPEDWPWSTYAQLVGLSPPWPCFSRDATLTVFGSVGHVPGTAVPGTR